MKKIACTYDEYDKIERIFSRMDWKICEYLPTIEEIDVVILPNLEKYILFLLWVDKTAIPTDENKETRNYIKKILRENIEFIDDISDVQEE